MPLHHPTHSDEPLLKASPVIIVPFPRVLPFELHWVIASYLSHASLKRYSLASRALNREVNRVLWRSIAVTPRRLKSEDLRDFVAALMRDPVRAGNIRQIGFVPIVHPQRRGRTYERSIFPEEPTGQLWTSVEEALRLLVHVKIVRLHLFESLGGTDLDYLDRLVEIVGGVFERLRVARLNAHLYLAPNRLFRLCQALRPLTTLSTSRLYGDPPTYLPPGALPQLRHVESDLDLICHIVPGRPIETLCHTGKACGLKDPDAFNRLTNTLRGCKTLLWARVSCCTRDEDDSAKLLPAFAHGNLREFYLTVAIDRNRHAPHSLTPSFVMQALSSGVGAYFPKLEFLHIILSHHSLNSRYRRGIGRGDPGAVVNTLKAFLDSESYTALNRVEISLSRGNGDEGVMHFIATRCPSGWKANVAKWDSAALPQFDDMI